MATVVIAFRRKTGERQFFDVQARKAIGLGGHSLYHTPFRGILRILRIFYGFLEKSHFKINIAFRLKYPLLLLEVYCSTVALISERLQLVGTLNSDGPSTGEVNAEEREVSRATSCQKGALQTVCEGYKLRREWHRA